MRPVMITTEHRGVFVGLIDDDQDLTARSMPMYHARMAIRWGTTRGVLQLAETGPTSTTLASAVADIPMLHDITAVVSVSPEAWEAWERT